MDDYTKRLVLCFSEKLDQAKVGYIEWNSFKLMAMVIIIVHDVWLLLCSFCHQEMQHLLTNFTLCWFFFFFFLIFV